MPYLQPQIAWLFFRLWQPPKSYVVGLFEIEKLDTIPDKRKKKQKSWGKLVHKAVHVGLLVMNSPASFRQLIPQWIVVIFYVLVIVVLVVELSCKISPRPWHFPIFLTLRTKKNSFLEALVVKNHWNSDDYNWTKLSSREHSIWVIDETFTSA